MSQTFLTPTCWDDIGSLSLKGMERLDLEREIKSGPNWWMGILGLTLILFAGVSQFGGSAFKEIWGLWVVGFGLIWLFPIGQVKLRGETLIARNGLWQKKKFDLGEVKWIDFGPDKKISFWFKKGSVELRPQFWKRKKTEAAARQIGNANIPYFDYRLAERSKLGRGQVSGCLDCHETFRPTELKTWQKLPKSILWGRKLDQYFTVCPNCKGHWMYVAPNPETPVTQQALQQMDDAFPMNEKTKLREIIGDTLTRQTFLQHGQ